MSDHPLLDSSRPVVVKSDITVSSALVYAGIAFLVTLVAIEHQNGNVGRSNDKALIQWLQTEELSRHYKHLIGEGCYNLVDCASLISGGPNSDFKDEKVLKLVEADDRKTILKSLTKLRNDILFARWLKEHGIADLLTTLVNEGVSSLKELKVKYSEKPQDLQRIVSDSARWIIVSDILEKLHLEDDAYEDLLWEIVHNEQGRSYSFFYSMFLAGLLSLLVCGMATTLNQPNILFDHSTASKLGFFTFITGKYLAPQNCTVEFGWKDPETVGVSVAFVVRFFQRNGRIYPISKEDGIVVEITQGIHKIATTVELGGSEHSDANKACVQFSVRRSGEYAISIMVGMSHIRSSPFHKHFLPGPPDPQKTSFVHHCSTIVCTELVAYHLFIEPRDKYSNLCIIEPNFDPSDEYSADVVEINSERPIPASFRWESHPHLSRVTLLLKFEEEGCYRAIVSYRAVNLQNGDFHIIVLNKADGALVQKNVAKKSHNIWYEAKLLSKNGDSITKSRKVFCYISPKQLTIKEYILKFIPKRLVTFRLCPSTKFQFKSLNNQYGESTLVIDDGCQMPVELLTADRNVIVATFSQFLMKNIGGSETFKDKQDFFYHEVRKLHQKHFHEKLPVKILRSKLLETSIKATKGFSTGDWCRNFEITFLGEQGLDCGGLRREWFELLCCQLFDPENLLFQRFKNDKQGLVHPNPKRPSYYKLKHYEFAGKIVGKCLYESALGSSYRQLVKARLSRSFLAQLIGLRVHFKYFEQDDPDLYVSKIKYILENDVETMDLYFTEDEYGETGQLLKVVDLIPNGANVQVTNQNKMRYLDALAQYRLANSIKDEVDHFLKGLNELIPDSLLCIFDENELELLMCGTGQYSIADFKANHAVSGTSYEFRKILDWFWTAVANFAEEERARLLQFTTGCSQLPPGGFGELNPKFHITAAPTFGNLPTAHTCFNQLCLPDYDSYEQFERALRLAINEGSEGFGMV